MKLDPSVELLLLKAYVADCPVRGCYFGRRRVTVMVHKHPSPSGIVRARPAQRTKWCPHCGRAARLAAQLERQLDRQAVAS